MSTIDAIAEIRRFNRFYTQKIGVLEEKVYHRPFSLGEARVLFEVANRKDPSASEIAGALGLDRGYLSRMLNSLEKKGLLRRTKSGDRRKSFLALTRKGAVEFATIAIASSLPCRRSNRCSACRLSVRRRSTSSARPPPAITAGSFSGTARS